MNTLKKYKFLFLILLFGLFFIPKDVFAAEVPIKELVLYNSSWQVLDSCKLSEENCTFAVSPVDGTVLYLRATYNYNFYAGNTYAFEWTFKTGSGVSYSFAPHRPNIGINGEYQDLTNVQWRQEKEEIISQNRFKTYYFYTDFTSKNTTSSSAYPPYVQAEISNPSSTSIYFESLSLSIVNKGADTGSIIQNSTQTIIDNQNKNHQEAEKTRKGILETLKSVPTLIIDGIKGLFIPEDTSFLDNFRESLVEKLGFIAEVPLAVLDFILNLTTASWEEFNKISFPSIEIFGFKFWDDIEISLQPAIDIFEPYLWITDILCVILCINTLRKWYESFAAGGGHQ